MCIQMCIQMCEHHTLPLPRLSPKPKLRLIRDHLLRAGYSYLYGKGYSVNYSVNYGEILIQNVKEDSSSDSSEESKANKVFALGSHLEKHYGPKQRHTVAWERIKPFHPLLGRRGSLHHRNEVK